MNACCSGASPSPSASPSTVTTSAPSSATPSTRQAFTRRPPHPPRGPPAPASPRQGSRRRPPTSTVQAPHWPCEHPFFVPVRSSVSRSRSSSEVRVSISTVRSVPFTVSETRCSTGSTKAVIWPSYPAHACLIARVAVGAAGTERVDGATRRSAQLMTARSVENRYIAAAVVAVGVLAVVIGLAVTRPESKPEATTSTAASTGGKAAGQAVAAGGIAKAPAFTAAQLNTLPGSDWITNGGSLANDRYSALDQINDGNVKQLKGVWMRALNKSGVATKYSAEGQPIVYRGTIYQSTGADDVFAVDVKTGKIRWQYQAHLDQQIDTVCCGWLSRGVAIGDGRVYIGQLDGAMVALDQATGKVVWKTAVADWRTGSGITAAPLYYDGRIYTGVTGGEFGVRGRLTALDATTGKELWRFYTVPGPGEVGHDTWPQNSTSWQHGGAPIWQTPSVDPKLGLIYFTTGNASPDVNGSKRAGDNLFTSSFVALDATTGKYRWHFQQVHHDIWDFDAPSPTVLFDAKGNGQTVPAIAEASKTGFLYMLNRQTGKPLYGIDEKPVEKNAYQHTAKTQPFPTNPPFASQTVRDDAYAVIQKQIADVNKNLKKPLTVRRGPIFSPQGHDSVTVTAPDASGGTNWQPSSYNPKTNLIYVCSQDGVAGYSASDIPGFKEGEQYIGSVIAITGFGPNPGHLTAIDAASGDIKWNKDFPES